MDNKFDAFDIVTTLGDDDFIGVVLNRLASGEYLVLDKTDAGKGNVFSFKPDQIVPFFAAQKEINAVEQVICNPSDPVNNSQNHIGTLDMCGVYADVTKEENTVTVELKDEWGNTLTKNRGFCKHFGVYGIMQAVSFAFHRSCEAFIELEEAAK